MNAALRAVTLAAAATLAIAPAAPAQVPDKFTNLQVFPRDIPRAELVQAMRSFAGALGVRCNHCHVGANPANLDGYDFAADTKETKKVARVMMKMTREINTRLLPQTGRSPLMEVRCVTCHRGLKRPEALLDVLKAAAQKDGVEAALQQYRELREKHYGRGGYDFGAPTLNQLAESLAESNPDGAIAVQTMNVEVNPNQPGSHALLGRLYAAKGDKAAAIAQFERAAALDPGDDFYRKRIEELKQPEPPKKP
jgi:tetratricopeptide (TPR) repeat protein